MTDSSTSNSSHQETGKSLWQRWIDRIRPKPDSSEALHQVFADAEDNQVIGAESRIMLEGVLRMAELTAGKVMVAAARMGWGRTLMNLYLVKYRKNPPFPL